MEFLGHLWVFALANWERLALFGAGCVAFLGVIALTVWQRGRTRGLD